MDREIFFYFYYKWHNISLKIVFKRSHCFWISPSETPVSRARHASVKTWEGWGGGGKVWIGLFYWTWAKFCGCQCSVETKLLCSMHSLKNNPSVFITVSHFIVEYIYIFLFLVRDLRFNNISVISNGDLAQLRYLTTLWVISSFSTLIILIWLVFVVVTFTVQFVTYL